MPTHPNPYATWTTAQLIAEIERLKKIAAERADANKLGAYTPGDKS